MKIAVTGAQGALGKDVVRYCASAGHSTVQIDRIEASSTDVPNSEILDYYAAIDLFVIPRIDDRAARLVTPLKPLEAMAMEIPVIAADLPALRELVSPGERGEVFRPSDPEHLADIAGDL